MKTPQKDMPNELMLNEEGLKAARKSLDDGAVTPAYGPHREAIIKLLNDSLATELVCVLRYKRHHFMASGLASPKIAEEFMVHANEESAHADRIAKRIVMARITVLEVSLRQAVSPLLAQKTT